MSGSGERKAESTLALIQAEVDRVLAEGKRPDAAAWNERFPELVVEIQALVALRTSIFDEHLDAAGAEGAEGDRETLLASFEAEVQDALNKGKRLDLVAWQARYPDLALEIEKMSERAEFVRDALIPDVSPLPSSLQRGERAGLGRYRLLRRIAAHAVGPVFLGQLDGSMESVELMVLRASIGQKAGWDILRAAENSRGIDVPGVTKVVEVGESEGVRFIAFEHVRGISLSQALLNLAYHGGSRTLPEVVPPLGATAGVDGVREDLSETRMLARAASERLRANPAHVAASIQVAIRICRVLAAAHLQGSPHLDLSPASIVIDLAGAPALRWFGFARHHPALRSEDGHVAVFRAPELLLQGNVPVDWRADIYGVGAILYGLLYLSPPIWLLAKDRVGAPELFAALSHSAGNLEGLPAGLPELLAKALAPHPQARPGSAITLGAELEAILTRISEAPSRRKRRRPSS